MKTSKNILRFICFFIILASILCKSDNSKKIFLQTRQEEEASNSINLNCYLESKEKTEPNGCFFDTPENLLRVIKLKLETYSEKCDLTNKEDVGQLYDIARGLGTLAGELYSDPLYKPTEEELENLQKEILSINFNVPDSSNIQFKDIENAFSKTLKEKWLNYTKTQNYPQFYVNNSLSLAAYAYAYNFLSNGYSNKTQCIEVNSANKAVLFIISKDINEEESPLFNKDISSVVKIEKEGTYKFGETTFNIKKYAENELFVFPESTANFAYVDLSNEKLPLTIRARKEGDIITPFGMKGSMKLKKYLNGKGVSKHRRDDIPLLCSDTEVLWVAGVGISDKIGVKDKPTHVIEVEKG